MSYCRFGSKCEPDTCENCPGSDLYIFENSDGFLECQLCRFGGSYWCKLLTEMQAHILAHDRAGHHVYKCSGWTMTRAGELRPFYVDQEGRRASPYANGKSGGRDLAKGGMTRVHRWEHWACEKGKADDHMRNAGWRRVPVPGKVWSSGNPAYRWSNTLYLALGEP